MVNAYYLNQYISTTLSSVGGIDDSQTTGIILASVTNITTDKPGVCVITYTDPLDTTKAEWVTYTSIDGSNELQGVTRGAEGYSAKSHDNGATIAFPLSESHINNLNDALIIGGTETNLVDGTIDDDTMATASATKLATSESIKAYVDNSQKPQSLYDNLLINGNMDISQRATTFVAGANNDDVYTLDQWNLLSDGNDVFDVSQEAVTDLPGSSYAIKLDVETAKRGGIIQFIEAKDAIKFRGQTVSLSFAVKSANISALRAGILSWDGTADTLTSDVVGTWADTPTPVANWTFENTPADLTVTSSWTTVKIEGIVLDTAGMNNLGIFIWTPNEETIGDIVYISQVKVNKGATATDFMPKSVGEELLACQRYAFSIRIPGNGLPAPIGFGFGTSANACDINVKFPVEMRSTPTMSYSNISHFQGSDGAAAVTSLSTLALTATQTTTQSGNLALGKTSSFTQYRPYRLEFSSSGGTTAYMLFTTTL